MLFLAFITLLAGFSFPLLFYFQRLGPLDFWWLMAGQLLFFFALVLLLDPQERFVIKHNILVKPIQNTSIGLFSAILLYGIFYSGWKFVLKIWPQSTYYINNVYSLKESASSWRLAFFLGLIIGPGEEILWRWFFQRRWAEILGRKKGFLFTSFFYSLVHLTTGNPFLVFAALVCGLFWGWLFFQYRSLLLNIVSHSLWDVAIFVFWPIL